MKLKRNIILLMAVVALISFSGCQKNEKIEDDNEVIPNQDTEIEDSNDDDNDYDIDETLESELFDIIEKIYEIKKPELALGNIPVDLNDEDSVKFYAGITDTSKVKDIAVSETMIGSQAYSLVLVQLNSKDDAETIAKEMFDGIDQRKWICVGADDLQVVAQDDLIMLFMVSSQLKDTVTTSEMVDAFTEVRGEVDIQLEK